MLKLRDLYLSPLLKITHQLNTSLSQTTGHIIHHSDRGMQYCSEEYQMALAANGMTPSDGYERYQNALAEYFEA